MRETEEGKTYFKPDENLYAVAGPYSSVFVKKLKRNYKTNSDLL